MGSKEIYNNTMISGLPIPHRIAGFAILATVIVLVILAHNWRGDIDKNGATPLRNSQYSYTSEHRLSQHQPLKNIVLGPTPQSSGKQDPMLGPAEKDDIADTSYYVFLQKFPLENSWKMIFHTEVIVCPRETFAADTEFLGLLDGLVQNTLSPSRFVESGVDDDTTKLPFAAIEKEQWMKQSVAGCVQLGYGGANCGSPCCGSPHKQENRNYALNSHQAVIGNAMGDYKELFFYGMSGTSSPNESEASGVSGISGDDAYKAVCHGRKYPICCVIFVYMICAHI